MALTKIKNTSLDDADLVALGENGIGTSANQIVQLDSTGKLPAVDGSNLTGMASGDLISTNNLSDLTNTTTARSNLGVVIGTNVQAFDADLTTLATNGIGTSANQIVKLDGSAKLPAVDGSNLTGIESLPSQTSQSGKFLTTDGSAASWGEAGGGGLVLVGSTDASGASTADLTGFSSTYDNYVIEVSNLTSTGASSILRGSLFLNDVHSTGGEYQSSVDRASVASSTYSRRTAYNTTYWEFSSDNLGSSGKEFGTSIRLFQRNSGNKAFTSSGVGTYGGGHEALARGFLEAGTNPITKIRFSSSSGNITGTFRLYGIKKA